MARVTAQEFAEKWGRRLKGATQDAFAAVAKAKTQDPGSKERGGDYGVFPRGQMVPEFDAGILAVAPGEVSGVVETQFGYHIIRRHTYAEIAEIMGCPIGTVMSRVYRGRKLLHGLLYDHARDLGIIDDHAPIANSRT